MKTMVFLLCFVSAWAVFAADPGGQSGFAVRQGIPMTQAERWKEFLESKPNVPAITLGRSDYVVSGALVAGLRRLPREEHLSLGQKFLRLPIIRMVVPGPMERPPGGTGRYFAWRNDNSPLPWTAAASRPAGRWVDWKNAEPDCSFLTLHR